MVQISALTLFALFMFLLWKKQRAKFNPLQDTLRGSQRFPGALDFSYQNKSFTIKSIGVQSFHSAVSGSYFTLDQKMDRASDFFLGPSESYRYISLGKPSEDYLSLTLEASGVKKGYLLKTASQEKSQKLKEKILADQSLQQNIASLLNKDFHYINSEARWEVEGLGIKKKFFLNLSKIEIDPQSQQTEIHALLDKFLEIAKLNNDPS